jgi:serine/threonine protein kinase/formylglycine-generating enzyme required for sulfatase activity
MAASGSDHPSDEILQGYGVGKLSGDLADSVLSHLENCDDCRRRVAELSADRSRGRLREAQARPDSPPSAASPVPQMSMTELTEASIKPSASGLIPPGLAQHPDYEILGELGRGGMGVVYVAHNKLMDRKEVLKVVNRELMDRRGVLDRFLREIRNAAQLQHANIVTAYSAIRSGESIVFAMEYVDGQDLASYVKTHGPLAVNHASYFTYQAALGLQYAHEKGLVHRDIKPSNLILAKVDRRAVVKVLDFGLAKATREGPVEKGLTHEGQMLGTPDYIAPEQSLDAHKADIRADIYSLGCTLHYLLTGAPPFQAASLYEVLQSHHSMEATPLNLVRPEVPWELAAVVAKMMAKDPSRRYQTPGEVARVLKPFCKAADLRTMGSRAELSQIGQPTPAGRVAHPGPGPLAAPNVAPASPAPPATYPPPSTPPEPKWQSLIAIAETELMPATQSPAAPRRGWPRPPWLGLALAAGLAMVGLSIVWFAWPPARVSSPGAGPERVSQAAAKTAPGAPPARAHAGSTALSPEGANQAAAETAPGAPPALARVSSPAPGPGGASPTPAKTAPGAAPAVARVDPRVPGSGSAVQAPAKTARGVSPARAGSPEPNPERVSEALATRSPDAPQRSTALLNGPSPGMKSVAKKSRRKNVRANVLTSQSTGMTLVRIEGGEFVMGSPNSDKDAANDEKPPHSVRVSSFYLATTELTQWQYWTIMRNNPSHFASTGAGARSVTGQPTEGHPVENVSWLDACRYCNALSRIERLAPYYAIDGEHVTVRDTNGTGYRLPTEAEWEYASRARTATRFCFGDDPRNLGEFAWYEGNADGKTHIVGQKSSNAFGLYDMHGNVAEWCWDGYDANYYAGSPAVDPQGPAEFARRGIRGGGWRSLPQFCRSAPRYGSAPDLHNDCVGFRVARSQPTR